MQDVQRPISKQTAIRHTHRAVAAIFPVILLAALIWPVLHTGPWFDEFWTYYFADPSIGLRQAFVTRWSADVHPPLFSFLAWLAGELGMPRTIEAGRMLNLIPLLAAAAFLRRFWTLNPHDRPFLSVYVPAVTALGLFTEAFGEYRSYFLSVCAFAILLVSLKRLDRTEEPLTGPNRMLVWSAQIVSLAICLNIHFMTALLAVALVGTFGIAALYRGHGRLFTIHLLTGIACSLPLLATTAAQWSYISAISTNFWLKTSEADAITMIAQAILTPIGRDQLLAIAWMAAIGLRIVTQRKDANDDRYGAILIAAIFASACLVLAYTAATGALTGRYLIPICLMMVALLATLTAQTLTANRVLHGLFLIACLVTIIQSSIVTANLPNWDEAARFVAAKQATCPGARIIPLRTTLVDETANVVENYQSAFQYLARRWNMRVGAVDSRPAARSDMGCADYYWIDNQFAALHPKHTLTDELLGRFPNLKGCTINPITFVSLSVVYEVSGTPSQCDR